MENLSSLLKSLKEIELWAKGEMIKKKSSPISKEACDEDMPEVAIEVEAEEPVDEPEEDEEKPEGFSVLKSYGPPKSSAMNSAKEEIKDLAKVFRKKGR
jgi:hypothetical protein